MRHIHTSIVSRHLATRENNKILRILPPHISSSEEILPLPTRRTLAQLRTNKPPFLKSYIHKVDAKSHPSPLCPFCNTHTHDTHHFFNCIHIRTTLSPLDLWTDPAGGDCWPDGRKSCLVDHNLEDRTPPLARVKGVGRQQQHYHTLDRAGQVTLNRLRTGHNRLNSHMHRRMNLVPSPLCTCGTEDQITEHIIKEVQHTNISENRYGQTQHYYTRSCKGRKENWREQINKRTRRRRTKHNLFQQRITYMYKMQLINLILVIQLQYVWTAVCTI